jgi:GNAT superfamily N-acetyltransferase
MKNLITYTEFLNEGMRRSVMQNIILSKYGDDLQKLILIEDDDGGLEINLIRVNSDKQGKGIATKIMNDIIEYADKNKKIAHLTPTDEYGSDVKRLTNFYKTFGFVKNSGKDKDRRFDNKMIRPVK